MIPQIYVDRFVGNIYEGSGFMVGVMLSLFSFFAFAKVSNWVYSITRYFISKLLK